MSAAVLAGRGAVALAPPPLPSPGPPAPVTATGFVPRLVGPGCIVASCASLQTAAALATTMFATFGPAGTGALRFLAAAVILMAVVRPRLRGRPVALWWSVAALGAATAATNLLLYEAIARIPLGTAGTLVFLGPFALALLGTARRLDLVWALAALAGVVLLTGVSTVTAPAGVAFALGAAGSVAASIVLAQRVGRQAPRLDGLALSIAAAALITLPLGLSASLHTAGLLDVPVVAAVGVLGIAIPYALEFSALRRVGARTYSVLLSLDPAIAALAGLLFLGQRLGVSGLLGMALVIAAGTGSVAAR